jgi:hypothetical protein
MCSSGGSVSFIRRLFSVLPRSLAVMVGVFFLMPLTSLAFHGAPWSVYAREGFTHAAIVVAAYWIAPWLLVGAILVRRFLFFPFYLFQCLLLAVHSYVYGNALPWDLLAVRYVLVACMAYLGVLLTNRDFLFPFLSKNGRAWRKARRFDVGVGLQLTAEGRNERVEALMENCSATGMGIRIPKEYFRGFLKKLRRGNRMCVHIDCTGLRTTLPVEVVWVFEYESYWTLGLRVLDTENMIRFVTAVTGLEESGQPMQTPHLQLLENDMRQTAFVLWMLFIMLSFGIPAFA